MTPNSKRKARLRTQRLKQHSKSLANEGGRCEHEYYVTDGVNVKSISAAKVGNIALKREDRWLEHAVLFQGENTGIHTQ